MQCGNYVMQWLSRQRLLCILTGTFPGYTGKVGKDPVSERINRRVGNISTYYLLYSFSHVTKPICTKVVQGPWEGVEAKISKHKVCGEGCQTPSLTDARFDGSVIRPIS